MSKKEKLKFHRIQARPSYAPAAATETISGYINRYTEFKKWDVAPQNEASEKYVGPSASFFFAPYTVNLSNILATAGGMTSLEFVIDGLYVPFDRTMHNLEDYASRIYVLESNEDGIYGSPLLALDNEASKKKLDTGTPEQKSITFYINPTNLKIVKKKYFQQIRTRGGWAFQHWGPQIGEILIEGTTGNIMPKPQIAIGSVFGLPILPQVVEEAPTEANSPALAAFREMEKWYDDDQNENAQRYGFLSVLEYRGRTYVGHFADFEYDERGTNPFQLYYRIRFLVHYDTSNLNMATSRARSQIVRNETTIQAIKQLRLASSEDATAEER